MYTGSIPPTSIYQTWIEQLELRAADDNQLVDLSTVTEITLQLRNPANWIFDLTLTMTAGQITLPSLGIIEWRAEVAQMGGLRARLYDLLLTINHPDAIVNLILGSVSIVE